MYGQVTLEAIIDLKVRVAHCFSFAETDNITVLVDPDFVPHDLSPDKIMEHRIMP
jgi:hypothetical protein